ncbi:SDR family oxidoreductase [Nostoc sp. UCD121]|uniref:SDR family oxidoreductase n=1 Tax=unclassified Nostoc TaxID=2593658 RepID=UPI001623C20D|nr:MULTISPECIES: SDR family oxidoreductase [unclassified Nostoc]MBC1221942.1 SDR family oxidoreductase [Nostoc sp. UCD120]MBC1275251.1 SDR family oxidoreductase [Nostoc sp. UCD121]MBC1295635.1 SDR family oxidoreductase [Nostoc sp. UCD122]
MQLKPINQQVVAVVGASSGIGRKTALEFAKRGASLIVSARSQPGLESLVDEISQMGGRAAAVTADVSEFEEVKAIADQAIQIYGRLDTWVHCAAVNLYATFEQTTPEEFKRIIDVNLLGQVHGAMAALPHIKREGRGSLIHVSSVEAKRSLPFHSAYAASKHGIDGFLEALRIELIHEKVPINVTNVMPASINTPLFNKSRTKLGVKPQGLPPIYEPQAVADAILYVAEHPTRDIIVGDAGQVMDFTQRLSPRLMDTLLLQAGFKLQKTTEPKPEDAPDNLFEPISNFDRVEGDFSKKTQPSVSTWLETHPRIKWGIVFTLGVAVLASYAGNT